MRDLTVHALSYVFVSVCVWCCLRGGLILYFTIYTPTDTVRVRFTGERVHAEPRLPLYVLSPACSYDISAHHTHCCEPTTKMRYIVIKRTPLVCRFSASPSQYHHMVYTYTHSTV